MFWSYGSFVGVRLSSVLATAILARILAPSQFGLVALATTIMAFLDMLQGLGVSDALVISQESELYDEADSAFVVSFLTGLGLWALSAALGPFAASWFHQPQLVLIMPALGSTFFISGISSTHYAIAMKLLDFRSRTAAELAEALARGVVGVALALFTNAGVWALVAGYIAGSIALSAVVWVMVDYDPRFRARVAHMRRLLGFGGALTGIGVMSAFLNQFDNVVVGKVLGPAALGFYSVANRLPYLLITSLAAALGQVLFPAFATLQGTDMARGFLTSLRYLMLLALPLTAGLIVLAGPITFAIFGSQWGPSVPAAQVLCIVALMSPLSQVSGNAIKSRGRARLLLGLAIPQAVALIIGSLLLVHQGIVAVSWVQAVIAVVSQGAALFIACRMFSVTLTMFLKAIAVPTIASAVLGVQLLAVHRLFPDPWLSIILGVTTGAVVYLGFVHLLDGDLLPRLRAMAFPSSS